MDQEHNNPTFGKCPHCGGDVLCGRYGFYCAEKCGMRIGKVYGKVLTKVQLMALLGGKPTTFRQNGKTTIRKHLKATQHLRIAQYLRRIRM